MSTSRGFGGHASWAALMTLCLLCLATGCTKLRDRKVHNSNAAKLFAEIELDPTFSAEEKRLLRTYRTEHPQFFGLRVSELLREQRELEKSKRQVEEVERERERRQAELRRHAEVELVSLNVSARHRASVALLFQNRSNATVEYFEGVLRLDFGGTWRPRDGSSDIAPALDHIELKVTSDGSGASSVLLSNPFEKRRTDPDPLPPGTKRRVRRELMFQSAQGLLTFEAMGPRWPEMGVFAAKELAARGIAARWTASWVRLKGGTTLTTW